MPTVIEEAILKIAIIPQETEEDESPEDANFEPMPDHEIDELCNEDFSEESSETPSDEMSEHEDDEDPDKVNFEPMSDEEIEQLIDELGEDDFGDESEEG